MELTTEPAHRLRGSIYRQPPAVWGCVTRKEVMRSLTQGLQERMKLPWGNRRYPEAQEVRLTTTRQRWGFKAERKGLRTKAAEALSLKTT